MLATCPACSLHPASPSESIPFLFLSNPPCLSQSADPLPFSFHLHLPLSTAPTADGTLPQDAPQIAIHNSIHQDLLLKHSQLVSTEDVFIIECEPEAVFRVREITRCSSSIEGKSASPASASVGTKVRDYEGLLLTLPSYGVV